MNVAPVMRDTETIRVTTVAIDTTPDGLTIDDIQSTAASVFFNVSGGNPGTIYDTVVRWATEQTPEQMLEALFHIIIDAEDGAGSDLRMAFRMQFPEFDRRSAREVDRALSEAQMIHNIRELVTLYVAAHVLTIKEQVDAGTTGATGSVKSDRVGPLESQYIALAKDGDIKAELARTQYGARALLLESRSPRARIGAIVAGA